MSAPKKEVEEEGGGRRAQARASGGGAPSSMRTEVNEENKVKELGTVSVPMLRVPLTRHILRSCLDIEPLFVEFVGFHLFQKGILPCPIDQISKCLDDVEVNKNAKKRLERFSESLKESISALCSFMAGLQGAVHSVKFRMLLGPSVGLPRDTFTLFIDTASSNDRIIDCNVGDTSPNSPYVTKLVKALTRQMIMNSQVFEYSCVNIPLRNLFFSVKVALYPGSESMVDIENNAESCPLFQYYTYRQGFQPKFRKKSREKVVTLSRSDISPAGGGDEAFCVLDFVSKKGLSLRF